MKPRILMACAVVLVAVACKAGPTAVSESPDATNPTAQPESAAMPSTPKELDVTNLNASFVSADGARFAGFYDSNAVLALSNGTVLRGTAALKGAAEKSGPSVAQWSLEDERSTVVGDSRYTSGKSTTKLTPPGAEPIEIRGQRLIVQSGPAGNVVADMSLPGNESRATADVVSMYAQLTDAWNAHDVDGTLGWIASDALYVLGDGTVHRGESELRKVISGAIGGKIRNFQMKPRLMFQAADDAMYVLTDYEFTIADGVQVSGCRADLWKRSAGHWKLTVQLAQPKGSAACL